jgi:hypothetical protein
VFVTSCYRMPFVASLAYLLRVLREVVVQKVSNSISADSETGFSEEDSGGVQVAEPPCEK